MVPDGLMQLWDRYDLDVKSERYAMGWKEHFLIFNHYLAEGLGLLHEEVEQRFVDVVRIMALHWEDGYPDPSMLTFLLYMKRHRPGHYARYLETGALPELADFPIDPDIYHLIAGLHEALTHSPSPMRIKERFEDFDVEIEAFLQRFGARFILPFDGRDTEQCYSMTAHLDEMIKALETL